LPRVVGMSAAATLLYSSEVISGREAERIGLVSKAVPAGDVVSQAVELAEKIASNPSLATRWAKRLLRHSLAADLHSQLRAEYTAQISLFDHPDTRQAIAATLARLREK
jgi:enoyl-CoA hydratase/carnithine racemase